MSAYELALKNLLEAVDGMLDAIKMVHTPMHFAELLFVHRAEVRLSSAVRELRTIVPSASMYVSPLPVVWWKDPLCPKCGVLARQHGTDGRTVPRVDGSPELHVICPMTEVDIYRYALGAAVHVAGVAMQSVGVL